jgi:hypothetical protein
MLRTIVGADDVERHGFRREDEGIAELAHHERADAERIAAGDHALRRHADQRIGAFELLERVDELVEQRPVGRGGDQVDDHLGIRRRLEDRAAADQVALELHRIGDVAVVRDREAAGRQIGIERLDVAQRGLACGGIADMAAGIVPGQSADHFVAVEIAGDMAHRAVRMELIAVETGDARGLLAAMLQRVETECDHRGGGFGTGDAENAAFLAELVVVERIRGEHRFACAVTGRAHIGWPTRFVALSRNIAWSLSRTPSVCRDMKKNQDRSTASEMLFESLISQGCSVEKAHRIVLAEKAAGRRLMSWGVGKGADFVTKH